MESHWLGVKFDFPMLCSECYRNGVCLDYLANWKYIDTLEVFKALEGQIHGGCVKLQCLLRHLAPAEGLRAHRALDDCFALREVLGTRAGRLGLSPWALLKPFALDFESNATLLHMSVPC